MNVEMTVGMNNRIPRRKIEEAIVVLIASHDRDLMSLSGLSESAYPEMTKKMHTIGGPE
jgi:hypothetical protein